MYYLAACVTNTAPVAVAATVVPAVATVAAVSGVDGAATASAAAGCHVWLATVYTGAANDGDTYAHKELLNALAIID